MRVRALTPVLGAEIIDANLSRPMSDETYRIINEAFIEHGVIVAKNQYLTTEQFVTFGQRFGRILPHWRAQLRHPDCPDITVLAGPPLADAVIEAGGSPRAEAKQRDADWHIDLMDWHSDLAYREEATMATAILTQEVPKSGGDLLFLSSYAAYKALPEALKKQIDGLVGTFCFGGRKAYKAEASVEKRNKIAIVEHPAVLLHPETGRKALYINPSHSLGFAGMSQKDADDLLDKVFDNYLVRPEWQYRHSWDAGDLVMWDNRCVFHAAMPGYAPEVRRPVWRIYIC